MIDRANAHRRLCDMAGRIVSRNKPCQKCNVCTYFNKSTPVKEGCCEGCINLTPKGCGTRNIFCKTWLCTQSTELSPRVASQLLRLQRIADKYNLLYARASEEQILQQGCRRETSFKFYYRPSRYY